MTQSVTVGARAGEPDDTERYRWRPGGGTGWRRASSLTCDQGMACREPRFLVLWRAWSDGPSAGTSRDRLCPCLLFACPFVSFGSTCPGPSSIPSINKSGGRSPPYRCRLAGGTGWRGASSLICDQGMACRRPR